MFSVITNIYNKKTKGPTWMELFTDTGRLKKFFFFTTRDVRCVHHGWHGTHRTSLVVKKKLFQSSCVCEQFHSGRPFGYLVINVCNHGEHYETPYILIRRGLLARKYLLILITNICCVYWLIKLTYIIAKHNGMAPIKHIMLLIRFIRMH